MWLVTLALPCAKLAVHPIGDAPRNRFRSPRTRRLFPFRLWRAAQLSSSAARDFGGYGSQAG